MKIAISIFIASLGLASIERAFATPGDLTLSQYKAIEKAMTTADASVIPSCGNDECSEDLKTLLRAVKLRIQWDLKASFKESQRCASLSEETHTATYYTCERLSNANAINLYGYYGHTFTEEALARSVVHACEAKLWGNAGDCASSPVVQGATKFKDARLEAEDVHDSGTTVRIPIFGDRGVQDFKTTDGKLTNTELRVNYPAVHILINGKDALMVIDTAAQMTSLYTTSAKRLGVTSLDGLTFTRSGITGAQATDYVGVARSITLGSLTVKRKCIAIVESTQTPAVDGVIGIDMLDKLHSLAFTPRELVVNARDPSDCTGRFSMSSDLYSRVYGLRSDQAFFNGKPAVAVLDTGNAASAVAPSWQLVNRSQLVPTNRRLSYSADVGGQLSRLEVGDIDGAFSYLGKRYNGKLQVSSSYPNTDIDFNIGSPFFSDEVLFINFDMRKMCLVTDLDKSFH